MKDKIRIFHGLYNIAGIPGIIAKHEREIGYFSKSICFPQGVYQRDVDEIITEFSEISASKFIDEYDIFNFHFGSSLLGQSLDDLALLRRMGKKIIMHFHGCDIRDSKKVMRQYEVSACHVCMPMACNLNGAHSVKMAEKHAHKILVYTPDLLEFVANSIWIPQPIDIEALEAEYASCVKVKRKDKNALRIVHAPSASEVKGSKYLQAAVANLINEGLNVEYVELTLKTHSEVIAEIAIADLVADQFLVGAYGVISMEAMAFGVPSICYLRENIIDEFPEDCPIINANIENIQEKIRYYYDNRKDLRDLGVKSRKYAQKYHATAEVSKRLATIYSELGYELKKETA